MAYILTSPHPQGHMQMSAKCWPPLDELMVQAWLLLPIQTKNIARYIGETELWIL